MSSELEFMTLFATSSFKVYHNVIKYFRSDRRLWDILETSFQNEPYCNRHWVNIRVWLRPNLLVRKSTKVLFAPVLRQISPLYSKNEINLSVRQWLWNMDDNGNIQYLMVTSFTPSMNTEESNLNQAVYVAWNVFGHVCKCSLKCRKPCRYRIWPQSSVKKLSKQMMAVCGTMHSL